MTDTVKSWIEERRAIQRDGRGCTCQIDWRYPCPEHSPGNPVSQMVLADSVREFPRALDALNAVLEVCDKALAVKVEGSSEGEVAMAAMAATVKRAIEGAVND